MRILATLLLLPALSWGAITHIGTPVECQDSTVGGAASCDTSPPTGATTGDLLVTCVFGVNLGNSVNMVITEASGHTVVAEETTTTGTDRGLGIYYKSYAAGNMTWQVSADSNDNYVSAQTIALRGVNATPLDVTYSSGSHLSHVSDTDDPNAPDITTTTDGAMIQACLGITSSQPSSIAAPAETTIHETHTAQHLNLGLAYAEDASAGVYTIGQWAVGGTITTADSTLLTVAFRPSTAGGCPAACAGGRTAVCITSTASNTDEDNILYGQSPAVVADADTLCHDATSDILGDAVTVSASGWVTFASGTDVLTDDFDYCIMDAGAACGTDGTFQITTTPVLTNPTGTATGQETADLAVTSTHAGEGDIYAYVSTSATPPSTANHISGGGSPAYHNADPTPIEAQVWSATGLTAGTTYYAHYYYCNDATAKVCSSQVTSDPFITTASGDSTPDPFEFGDLVDTVKSAVYYSNDLTITGLTAAAVVVLEPGPCEWRVKNGGPWGLFQTIPGELYNNYVIQLKATSSSEEYDSISCTITIGGVSDTWTITSALATAATAARDFSEWFYNQEGYTGAANERMRDFLYDQGYVTGSLNSALFEYLRDLGYTGTLTNMIDQFERDVTTAHGN